MGVRRGQGDLAPAFGMKQDRANHDGVVPGWRQAREPGRRTGRQGAEQEMDIGRIQVGPGLEKRHDSGGQRGGRPGSGEIGPRHVEKQAVPPAVSPEGSRGQALVPNHRRDVIL